MVQGWVATILAALEDEEDKSDPLEHRLVRHLLPGFLKEVEAAEAAVIELKGRVDSATAAGDDDEEGGEPEFSEAEVRALKKDLAAARRRRKEIRARFAAQLQRAAAELSAAATREAALAILAAALLRRLLVAVDERRRAVARVVGNWWAKYKVALPSLDSDRDRAAKHLRGFLDELGYD